MGRYAEKWTAAQREAVTGHVLDRGGTAAEASRLARAGELYGLEAFDLGEDYARELVRAERKRRNKAPVKLPASVPDAHAELERDGLERIARGVSAAGDDPDQLAKWWKAWRALRDACRQEQRKAPGNGDPTPPEPVPDGLAAAAEQLAARRANGSARDTG